MRLQAELDRLRVTVVEVRTENLNLPLGVATEQQTSYRLGGRKIFRQPETRTSRRPLPVASLVVEESTPCRREARSGEGATRHVPEGHGVQRRALCEMA